MLRKLFSLLFIVVLLCASCKTPAPKAQEQATDSNLIELNAIQMKQVTLDTVRLKEETTDLALSGKVSFNLDYLSPVYSFVGGSVLKVNVSQGDYVTKGQVLAVLKSGEISDFEGQYGVAQAQAKTAKRNL